MLCSCAELQLLGLAHVVVDLIVGIVADVFVVVLLAIPG